MGRHFRRQLQLQGSPGSGKITDPGGAGAAGAAGDMAKKLGLSLPIYTKALACANGSSCAFWRARGDLGLMEKCIFSIDTPEWPAVEVGSARIGCMSGCVKLMKEKCDKNPTACMDNGNGNS